MMAFSGTVALLLVILFAWIFIHSLGNSFMIAANSSSGLPKGITATPTYFFLAAASVGNTAFAIFVVVTYLLFWIGVTYYVFLPVTRSVFAYAFDGLLPKSITKVNDRTHIPLGAMLLAFGLTEIFFIWALRIGNFIEVLTYATLIQLISMGLVGLTAAIVPWRKPMLYKAGATQTRVLGVPVVTIAGGGAVLASVLLWLLYFHWPSQFGLSNYGQFFTYVFGTMVAGVAFFWIITLVKRRRGFDQRLVYKEIPPE